MANLLALTDRIKNSGITKKFIAEKLNISVQSLINKLTGKRYFNLSEMNALADLLNLTDAEKLAIFFYKET